MASPLVRRESPALTRDARVVATVNQISADVAGETVLLSMTSGEYYGLNPVASMIWKLVQEERMVRDICLALREEFDGVGESECEREVVAFLARLIDLRMVEIRTQTR